MKKVLMSVLILTAIASGSLALADGPNLGENLSLKMNASGVPAFGAIYTYGDDPDGSHYTLNFSANSTNTQQFRWNLYVASTNTYLLDWSSTQTTSLTRTQVMLSDASVVSKLLASQKVQNGKADLYFVLADTNNVPMFNLSISDICATFPTTFKNMTDEKRCDQF